MSAKDIIWAVKPFNELTTYELYDILRLRADVFVVEQNCAYQDLDGIDLHSFHLMGRTAEGAFVCTMRIIPCGVEFDGYGSIGRIVVARMFRGGGMGHDLLRHGLDAYRQFVEDTPIMIDAQAYLQKFYEGYGFKAVSGVFDLDGLPHIRMIASLN